MTQAAPHDQITRAFLAPGVRVAITGRAGGVSDPPYDTLNLGRSVGDDPEAVARNRAMLAGSCGVHPAKITWMRQVHGAEVVRVADPGSSEHPECDAVFTAARRIPLAVLAADCAPVLLADPEAGLAGAAHAGRAGMEAGVVPALVEAMTSAGAHPARMRALIGPAVCGGCYDVPDDLRARVCAAVPQAYCVTRDGRPGLDITAGIAAQLAAVGIRAVERDGRCTAETPELYSHRRDGRTGRFAALVWIELWAARTPVAGTGEAHGRTSSRWQGPVMNRQQELEANLATVRKRIAAACDGAGRDMGEITMIAVTKTFPASDIRLLAGLGVTQIGENRDSEAAPKVAETADLDLTWHFVGQLQTRRCRSVSRYASVIHSVDRDRLVRVLGREARRAGRELSCLVQVSLDGPDAPPGRGGAAPDRVVALAGEVAAEDGLRLGGVMAVAPVGVQAREAMPVLTAVAADVRAAHPGATIISAGMSGDLEEAVESGATHLRIGTALLGARRASVR